MGDDDRRGVLHDGQQLDRRTGAGAARDGEIADLRALWCRASVEDDLDHRRLAGLELTARCAQPERVGRPVD